MGLQSYLVVVSLVVLVAYLLYKLLTKNDAVWPNTGVQLLRMENFIRRIVTNQTFLQLDMHLYRQMKDLPYGGYMEGTNPVLLVRDMEIIKHIYVKDFDHFVNRRNFYSVDAHWNNMLFNKSDTEWKDLRSTMSPTFTTGKIKRMFPILKQSSVKLISYLKETAATENGIVNLEDALGRYAMDVISSAAFGIDSGIFKDPNSKVAKMAKKFQIKFSPVVMLKFFATTMVPTLARIINFSFLDQEADGFFTKILKDSIKYRETSAEKRDDFLQLMIETKSGKIEKETAEEMDNYEKDAQLAQDKKREKFQITDDIIVANCILFIFGGFDTTQSALIFAAYSLALYPDVQEKLRREISDAVDANGGELNYDIVNRLQYLDYVINETLRMYPPAVRTERKCTKDFTLPNSTCVVPKDSLVGIPVYQIHHDEKHFPKPEVFDPERFTPENKAKRHPYAWMPFGHGPRNCIANRFALTETKNAIATLVMNFDIEPCSKTSIPMEFASTTSLKPVNGMWLKLNPRQSEQ